MNLAKTESVPLSFKTPHLYIRRYETSDDQALFTAAIESIEHVYPFLPWCHPAYSIEETREWLATITPDWNKGNGYGFGIFDIETKDLLGGCGFNRIDEHAVANLGYWIRATALGRGVATEATSALAEFAFKYARIRRIEIIMSVENEASRRVAEKAGATYEGRLRNRLYLHGKTHDAHCFSLIPDSV